MSVWFEGNIEIESSFQKVKHSLENLGEHYLSIISLMPGLTSVELLEQGNDFVTIKTNEGLMKRTKIIKRIDDESISLEFDEEYQAGSKITTRSHFLDEFTKSDTGVKYHTVISEVKASGLLGFFYRNLGSSNTGKSFLNAHKAYLEKH